MDKLNICIDDKIDLFDKDSLLEQDINFKDPIYECTKENRENENKIIDFTYKERLEADQLNTLSKNVLLNKTIHDAIFDNLNTLSKRKLVDLYKNIHIDNLRVKDDLVCSHLDNSSASLNPSMSMNFEKTTNNLGELNVSIRTKNEVESNEINKIYFKAKQESGDPNGDFFKSIQIDNYIGFNIPINFTKKSITINKLESDYISAGYGGLENDISYSFEVAGIDESGPIDKSQYRLKVRYGRVYEIVHHQGW